MVRLRVLITAYNRADFLNRCIASVLHAVSDALDIRVLVMDNGSTDDTSEVAASFGERVQVQRTDDNRHIVEVLNRGMETLLADETATHVLVMNDDTEFTPGSVERLVSACESHPDSMLTPLQLNFREPGKIDNNAYGHVLGVRDLIEDAVLGRPLRQAYPLRTIIGAAMFARREVWKTVGEFDPLFWFYGLDDDLCTRARWLGYEILLAPEARLYHAHGKLDEPPKSQDPAAALRKWRNETQARYLFLLKDPRCGLPRNVLRTVCAALKTCLTCLSAPWPGAAWRALTICADCLVRLPRIAATRRSHFDRARRSAENECGARSRE